MIELEIADHDRQRQQAIDAYRLLKKHKEIQRDQTWSWQQQRIRSVYSEEIKTLVTFVQWMPRAKWYYRGKLKLGDLN